MYETLTTRVEGTAAVPGPRAGQHAHAEQLRPSFCRLPLSDRLEIAIHTFTEMCWDKCELVILCWSMVC